MKRIPTVVGMLVAALVVSAPAGAKEMTKATIWGASGSITVDDPGQLRAIPTGGPYRIDPPKLAPFYTIDVTVDAGRQEHSVLMYYVPSANAIAGNGEFGGLDWFPIEGASTQAAMRSLVRDLEPYRLKDAWPPGLKSVEQIDALAGASVPSEDGSRSTWLWAALAAVGAAGVAVAVLLAARRRTGLAPRAEGA